MGRRLKGEPSCLVLCLRRTGVWAVRLLVDGVLGFDLVKEERLWDLGPGWDFFVRLAFLGATAAGVRVRDLRP